MRKDSESSKNLATITINNMPKPRLKLVAPKQMAVVTILYCPSLKESLANAKVMLGNFDK